MPHEEHRGSRWRHSAGPRAVVGLVLLCALLGAAQALSAWGGPGPAGATTASGSLSVDVTAYAGDVVTSAPSGSVLAGSDVTYQVAVTNTATSAQSDVSVPVTMAPNFTLHQESIATSTGTASTGGGILSWSVGSLAGGATATLTYTETADAPSSLESDSTVASATSDQSATASTAGAAVGVVPAADLTIAVSDGVDSVTPGISDTYVVTLTDDGPSAVTDATVTDTFTPDVGALGASSSLGDAGFTDLGGGQGDWTGVDLASGASATFDVGATIPTTLSPGSTVLDLATVALPPGQLDTATTYDAVDSDVVTGGAAPGALALSIASSDGGAVSSPPSESVLAGGDVTYQVTVTNQSTTPQTGVSVPVSLPPAFTLASEVTVSAGSSATAGGVVNWSIPSLTPGSSATMQYTESTDTPGSTEADTTSASAVSAQSAAAVTASDTVEVIPAADLSVSVDDGVDIVAPGSSLTYTVTVTNHGPSAATDATVTEAFDGGFTALVDVSSLEGTSFSDLGADEFAWSGVNLASGASATFSLIGDLASSVASGSAFVDVATVALPPGQVDTAPPSSAVDADAVVATPQAISFSAPAAGVVGQSLVLSADGGGSGNPVVFSVDPSSGAGVCAVSGSDGTTLAFTAPGTCVVDANEGGDAGFAAAPTVSASIVVEQAPAFTSDTPPTTAVVGQSYAYSFAAGGSPPPAFALAAGAPSWLTVDTSAGSVAGTPPAGTNSFTYSVVATNVAGSVTAGPFTVTVAPSGDPGTPDLSVGLSCPRTMAEGAEGSCVLTVQNTGSGNANSVAAAVVLPFRLRLVDAPGSVPWFANGGAWRLGSLGPDASATVSVSFRAVVPGQARVVAGVLGAEPGASTSDRFASAPVLVTEAQDARWVRTPPVSAPRHPSHGRR